MHAAGRVARLRVRLRHALGPVDINTAQPAACRRSGSRRGCGYHRTKPKPHIPFSITRNWRRLLQSLGPPGHRLRIGGQTMYTLRATARLRQPDGKLSDLRRTVGALVKF